MPKKDPFRQYGVTMFFHFTDRRNLALIRKFGLCSSARLRKMGIAIPAPGGNEWSQEADANKGMDRYVHLCFKANHPMEYLARQDGRIKDSIFLQIHPDVLQIQGIMFSAGVSNKTGVEIVSIEKAYGLIDFEVLYTRTDWSDPEVQMRLQQAEKCEILVPDHISTELIRNLPND
jgi:hypothetical protein